MDKKVRVNAKYGNWFYRKEVDLEDSSNYMYYIYGTDSEGVEWSWSTVYYNEILAFIKASAKDKQTFIDCY
jgi:hypothetical protein